MDKKSKARSDPRKTKIDDKSQSERFIATARELESDESGEIFEKVSSALFRHKDRPQHREKRETWPEKSKK